MNDDEIWDLARKPVTEFIEAIQEMNVNVDRLIKFYHRYTKFECGVDSHQTESDVPMEQDTSDDRVLSPLACAKLQLAIVFAINACYWMYLVTEGEDPQKNEISKDIERIRLFMNRAKEVERAMMEPCHSAKRPKINAQPMESTDW